MTGPRWDCYRSGQRATHAYLDSFARKVVAMVTPGVEVSSLSPRPVEGGVMKIGIGAMILTCALGLAGLIRGAGDDDVLRRQKRHNRGCARKDRRALGKFRFIARSGRESARSRAVL
jgi:hypothetical protein